MKKNRYPQALRSLIRLRHNKIQACRDLYYIHVQLLEEQKIIRGETYVSRFMELFTIPRVRRATVAATVVMLGKYKELHPQVHVYAGRSVTDILNAGPVIVANARAHCSFPSQKKNYQQKIRLPPPPHRHRARLDISRHSP